MWKSEVDSLWPPRWLSLRSEFLSSSDPPWLYKAPWKSSDGSACCVMSGYIPTVRSVAVADSSEACRPPSIPNQHAYCSRISLQKVLKRRNDSMLMACLSVWRWCSAASTYCWEISVFEGQIPCYPSNCVLLVNYRIPECWVRQALENQTAR